MGMTTDKQKGHEQTAKRSTRFVQPKRSRAEYHGERHAVERNLFSLDTAVIIFLVICVGFLVYGAVRVVLPDKSAVPDTTNDLYDVVEIVEYE